MEENIPSIRLCVSDFIALANQTLEYAYPSVEIEGEVAGFKVNQQKYVFFDLKDKGGTVNCFMTVWQLRVPLEDGMKVVVTATPKLTPWGKFSVTVRSVRPSGEGSLKKSFELLKAKLEKEGVFAAERKRPLPYLPVHVGVISSTQAAGYADFMKIVNDRWGGLELSVAHTQVQGVDAPDQIIRAIRYFNESEQPPEALVIIRGGGSADDLSVFNDEHLVRAIAGSRIVTLVGVGHEVDVTLADMAADVRAATPSNAAQLLVPSRTEVLRSVRQRAGSMLPRVSQAISDQKQSIRQEVMYALGHIEQHHQQKQMQVVSLRRMLDSVDPARVLARGYALVRGTYKVGATIAIETAENIVQAEVRHVSKK